MLSVEQMAGGVVSRPLNSNVSSIAKPDLFELLSNIANASAELSCFFRVPLVLGQHVSVSSQHRAATAGVSYYRGVTVLEGVDIPPRQDSRAVKVSRVRVQ